MRLRGLLDAPSLSQARRREPLAGQLPTGIGWFDRGDTRHGVRIERDVESRTEADLDDVAAQALAGTLPLAPEPKRPADDKTPSSQ